MPLSIGDKFGPYEFVSPIGAGGMGEVCKAQDTSLVRTVAIKALPEHVAAREELRLGFEREARAVASLNHPHIREMVANGVTVASRHVRNCC